MGMTIDKTLEYLTDFSIYSPYQEAIDKVSAYIEQMQAASEARLKADMKAILVELQLEIEELCIDTPLSESEEDMNRGIELAADAIQQKINKLKG